MHPEQRLWDSLRPRLRDLDLDPHRIENGLASGTPDVNYTQGWIELKDHPCWPKRPFTPVRLQRLIDRPTQVSFLVQRWTLGGLCWLMVRIAEGSEMFLFSGWDSQFIRAGLQRSMWYQTAAWTNGGSWSADAVETLDQLLNGDPDRMTPHIRARYDRLLCRKSLAEVAEDMGIDSDDVLAAEHGKDESVLQELLEYWEA